MTMIQCPKCPGIMREYNRNGVHIDQCESCRGIFLDYGELEHLTQMEARYTAPPAPQQHAPGPTYVVNATPPGYGAPAWGGHGGGHYGHRKKGWAHMLFST